MARYNNKKLQVQRNFQSIWHTQSEKIGTLLKEDQLIREYIIGSLSNSVLSSNQRGITSIEKLKLNNKKGWKLSEIIIKRKVKEIHIAFQIHNKIIKERKRWTKNRLKNSNKSLFGNRNSVKIQYSLANRIKLRKIAKKRRYLYFQLYLMIINLRKMYPNNKITFYIQKVKPLQFNANLINSWIIENIKKKKSYKRLLNKVISKFKKAQKLNYYNKTIYYKSFTNILMNKKSENKTLALSWITGHLIYLYNLFNKLDAKSILSNVEKNSIDTLNIAKRSNIEKNSIKTLNISNKDAPINKLGHKQEFIAPTGLNNKINYYPIWLKWKKQYNKWKNKGNNNYRFRKKQDYKLKKKGNNNSRFRKKINN